jgi:hypothetical protein
MVSYSATAQLLIGSEGISATHLASVEMVEIDHASVCVGMVLAAPRIFWSNHFFKT